MSEKQAVESLKRSVAHKMSISNIEGATREVIDYFGRDNFEGTLEYFDLNTYDGEMSFLEDDLDELNDKSSHRGLSSADTKRSRQISTSIQRMKADPTVPYWTRETDDTRPMDKHDLLRIVDTLESEH